MPSKSVLPILKEMGIALDEDTQKIIKMLEQRKIVPESKIADRLKLKINTARKLLYRLHERNLVTYTKQRDKKKKWWYLYYWSLDKERIRDFYVEYIKKQIVEKEAQLAAESKYVFGCEPCDLKFTYEEALDSEFMCPKCGEILMEISTTKLARKLKRQIVALKKELEKLEKPKKAKKSKKPKR